VLLFFISASIEIESQSQFQQGKCCLVSTEIEIEFQFQYRLSKAWVRQGVRCFFLFLFLFKNNNRQGVLLKCLSIKHLMKQCLEACKTSF